MPRILLAEDDDSLRGFLTRALERAGYDVTSCADGEEAAAVLDENWDLLLTDIVMPGMDGRKLAEEALKRRPEIKVLFTTGYAPNSVVHNGALDYGEDLISKPYSIEQLASKIRDVLDRPRTITSTAAV